jgi:hypothetical protein
MLAFLDWPVHVSSTYAISLTQLNPECSVGRLFNFDAMPLAMLGNNFTKKIA